MGESELYETDFIGWTEQQGRMLREIAARPGNDALDWSHIAEEIESLGRSHRRALISQAERLITHLFKLEHSNARPPRSGWMETVRHARREIAATLEDEPGLGARLPELLYAARRAGRKAAILALQDHGETEAAQAVAAAADHSDDQLLSDWMPGTADMSH